MDTGQQCADQGIHFFAVVIEGHAGGLSPAARELVADLSKEIAPVLGADPDLVSLRIAQRISCSLQRESARAILRRRELEVPLPTESGWDAVPMDPE